MLLVCTLALLALCEMVLLLLLLRLRLRLSLLLLLLLLLLLFAAVVDIAVAVIAVVIPATPSAQFSGQGCKQHCSSFSLGRSPHKNCGNGLVDQT